MSYLLNLDMDYLEAVSLLKTKYGTVDKPYFTEDSYKNFMNGVIYAPVKSSGISRTNDGLYIHHVLESELPLLSTPEFLKAHEIDFESQKSDNLVYANLLEHFMLHIMIGDNTNGQLGYPGAYSFIGPELVDWFYNKIMPDMIWKQNCYNAVLNSGYDVFSILNDGYRRMGFKIDSKE